MHRLIRTWRKLNTAPGQQFILPEDEGFVSPKYTVYFKSLRLYRRRDKAVDDGHLFQTGLLPVPYVGRLTSSSVFLLLNNPGFSENDYDAELALPDIRNLLVKNLRQSLGRERYPFICLNPAFSKHPGFNYWESKFRLLVDSLRIECGTSYDNAVAFIAKQVACVQLVPYHSKELTARHLLSRLPSTKLAIDYVHNEVLPRAAAGQALVVVLRGHDYWNLPHKMRNVLAAPKSRNFSLGPNSPHGAAILTHLTDLWRTPQAKKPKTLL